MKINLMITLKRDDGPKADHAEIAEALREEIESIDLWVDESSYELSVSDATYPDGSS